MICLYRLGLCGMVTLPIRHHDFESILYMNCVSNRVRLFASAIII